jgi:hypothetical protein
MRRRIKRRTLGPPPIDVVLTTSHARASAPRADPGREVTRLIASVCGRMVGSAAMKA